MGFAVAGRGILTLRNAAIHHVIHSHDSQNSIAGTTQFIKIVAESGGSILFHRMYSLLLHMVLIMGVISAWRPPCMSSHTWKMSMRY